MTLKDQFDVKGYDSTLGYVGRAFKPAVQDCVLVSMLKQMGAVIIAKSNLPQSIMVRLLYQCEFEVASSS
jgi:amidase